MTRLTIEIDGATHTMRQKHLRLLRASVSSLIELYETSDDSESAYYADIIELKDLLTIIDNS